jgi:hypothetical protein
VDLYVLERAITSAHSTFTGLVRAPCTQRAHASSLLGALSHARFVSCLMYVCARVVRCIPACSCCAPTASLRRSWRSTGDAPSNGAPRCTSLLKARANSHTGHITFVAEHCVRRVSHSAHGTDALTRALPVFVARSAHARPQALYGGLMSIALLAGSLSLLVLLLLLLLCYTMPACRRAQHFALRRLRAACVSPVARSPRQ